MTRVDLVVLDFDGTVCDSADVKTEAFGLLYAEHGEDVANAVVSHHLANVGVTRTEKIRYAEEVLLGRPHSTERVDQLAARFGTIVEEQVIAAPLLPGVATFLSSYSGEIPIAVASATPTDELRRIVAAKGLARFFAAVEGYPPHKGAILSRYVDRYGAAPQRTAMVGDQLSDLEAAEEAGTLFVGMRPNGAERVFADTVPVVTDLGALPAVVEDLTQNSES